MAFTKNVGGRPIAVPKQIRTARDLIRRHLREERKTVKQFSEFIGYAKPTNLYEYFYRTKRYLPPQIIDAAIEFLKLDEFDALELRIKGAIEAGWQIQDIEKARL